MSNVKDAVTEPARTSDQILTELLSDNRGAIEAADGGYCCNCSRFVAVELLYWLPRMVTDGKNITNEDVDAQCSFCLVDAVIAKDVDNVVQVGAQYKLEHLSLPKHPNVDPRSIAEIITDAMDDAGTALSHDAVELVSGEAHDEEEPS
jgi:hypothetical protein